MAGNNPRVDRYLKNKPFDRMDHALGRYLDPLGETHRNYFATEAESDLAREFEASDWWAKSGQQDEMAYYHVTEAGKLALKQHLAEHAPNRAFKVSYEGCHDVIAALTASKAKYAYFLGVRDFNSELTFIDFSRAARVRRVA